METLAIILVIASIVIFVLRFFVKYRMELGWLTLIISVCAMCSLMTDTTLKTIDMVIALMPIIFVMLFAGLDVMGYGGRK